MCVLQKGCLIKTASCVCVCVPGWLFSRAKTRVGCSEPVIEADLLQGGDKGRKKEMRDEDDVRQKQCLKGSKTVI